MTQTPTQTPPDESAPAADFGFKEGGKQHPPVKYEANALILGARTLKGLVLSKSFQASLARIAPKHISAERIACMAITAASRNPRLLECTQESVLKSLLESGSLGLDCSGLLGRGYLIPYKNGNLSRDMGRPVYEAQFQAGYLGLCDLARRSGEVVFVEGKAVYSADKFDYEEGSNPRIVHKPSLDPKAVKTQATLQFVYARAKLKGGEQQFRVMTLAEVENHRQRSRAKDSGPWVSDFVAMAIKTVIRQLCKFLPQSPELEQVLAKEIEVDAEVLDVEVLSASSAPAPAPAPASSQGRKSKFR